MGQSEWHRATVVVGNGADAMSYEDNVVRLIEGEHVVWTFTVYRGGSAVDLSAATVTFDMKDDDADKGDNIVTAGATAWATDGSDGVVEVTFTSVHTTISGDELKGAVRLKAVTGAIIEKTKPLPLYIERDDFIA